MKWHRVHRPRIHWLFWTINLTVQLFLTGFLFWAGKAYPNISTGKETIMMGCLCLLSFGMTRIWQHHLDNPKEYEELHKARARRVSRRNGRARTKRKDSQEKKD